MTGRVFTLGVLVLACGRTDMGLLDSVRTEAGGAGALGGDGGAAGSLGGDGGIAGSASGARGGASAGASAGSGNGGEAGTGPVGCALRVGALSPGDRERDVPTSTIIEANVACADGREPNWEALTLTVSAHGRPVEGRVESDVYLGIVRFFPARSLALAATFDVVLTDTRTGVASGEWHFTTRDGHWQTPAVMKGTDQWLAVDDSEHALLFFMNSAGNEVWSTRFEAETLAWTTPQRFPRRALTPVAAFDRQGGTTIAWGQSDNGYPSVWAARALEGSDPMPVELRSSDAPYSRFQSAAFRADGTGLVVWSDNPTSTGYRDRLLARAFGDDSSAEPRILARETGLLAARVAVEADGGAWVVWHQSDGPGNAVYARHRASSGEWSDATMLASGSVGDPRVAAGGGNAIFLWTKSSREEQIQRLWARTFDGRLGWGDDQALDATGDRPAPTDWTGVAYPQIAMDERGYGLAVWTTTVQYVTSTTPSSTSFGNRSELRAQRYDFAGGWAQAHVPLGSVAESSEQRHPNEPCVAFDAYGNALVLWAEGVQDARAQAARFLFESGFQDPATVATVATAWRGSAGPRVALDAFGRGFAAWHGQEATGTEFDLFAVRFSDD